MSSHYDVLIIGAGHGGAQAAMALRKQKFDGSIAIIGDEPELPYERPPLSKEYFARQKEFGRILIRPAKFWEEQNISLLLDRRVITVDADAQQVITEKGEAFAYSDLIWATGGSPRKITIPGHDVKGIHVVRTRADIEAITRELDTVKSIVIIGGGYIGLEMAATLTKFKKEVTLVEAQDRVLERVAGEAISHFFEAEHRAHGIDFRLNMLSESFLCKNGHISAVKLANDEVIPCEMAIIGIGIIPATAPLSKIGAKGSNGVNVNKFCQTSLPHIYAIGDCAAHTNSFSDNNRIRLESVQNANDMANTAALAILGDPKPYHAVPWFWSSQYDLKLLTVGLSSGYDKTVIRGNTADRSFSVIYLKEGRVIALDCVNMTRDYVQGRKLVETSSIVDPEKLADTNTPLKEMVNTPEQP